MKYVVTTQFKGRPSRTQIWDTSKPFPIGHPFQFVLTRNKDGVSVRDLTSPMGKVQKSKPVLITDKMIADGKACNLGTKDEATVVTLRETQGLPAAYEGKSKEKSPDRLEAYCRMQDFIMGAEEFTSSYYGRTESQKIFYLKRKGDQVTIKAQLGGVRVGGKTLDKGSKTELSLGDLLKQGVAHGEMVWNFAPVSQTQLPDLAASDLEPEGETFKRSLGAITGMILLFLFGVFLMPKPDPEVAEKEELIPVQYAKTVMKPAAQQPEPAGEGTSGAPKVAKAKKTKIARAFRAKALRNNVRGLLKGGMTKLLSQSNLVAGANTNSRVNKIFGSKSTVESNHADLKRGRKVAVNKIGGSGGKGKVGYGSGTRAGIRGQGTSFVSLDLAGSDVAEGLTQDEVGRIFEKHRAEIRYCYETSLIRNPNNEGKLTVDFTIVQTGRVKSAGVLKSSLNDARLDDCIIRRLVKWKFPKPKGGVTVAVTYPLVFKTMGR